MWCGKVCYISVMYSEMLLVAPSFPWGSWMAASSNFNGVHMFSSRHPNIGSSMLFLCLELFRTGFTSVLSLDFQSDIYLGSYVQVLLFEFFWKRLALCVFSGLLCDGRCWCEPTCRCIQLRIYVDVSFKIIVFLIWMGFLMYLEACFSFPMLYYHLRGTLGSMPFLESNTLL